jgi:AcrR family transcriptional regulator
MPGRAATRPATRTRTRKAAPAPREAYHHGDLRAALIEASEALLAERGPEGFSLREVARRSGVSPAAPAHHFGDSQGLLTAVATLAFDGLTAALEAGNARGGTDALARLREQGVGYVGFALAHPGRFGVMFSAAVRKDEALQHSACAAFNVLEDGVRRLLGVPGEAPLAPAHWGALVATWSVVHGFAHLALAGRFEALAPTGGREALLRQVLAPLLEQQLRGLLPAAPPASRVARRRGKAATSGPR